MIPIQANMHQIRLRFCQGILMKLDADQLRGFVTGMRDNDERKSA